MSTETDTAYDLAEQAAADHAAILARSTGTHHLFDHLRFRDGVKPDADRIAYLRANARSAPDPKRDKWRNDFKIAVTAPNSDARLVIAEQYWRLVYAEPAREICFADRADAVALHHFRDAYFAADPRRRLRIETTKRGEHIPPEVAEARRLAGRHTTYTGARDSGFQLVWYTALSKVTGEPCLKIEARIRFADQLGRFGLATPDLFHFPINRFLDDHDHLAVADPELVAKHLALTAEAAQQVIDDLSRYPGGTYQFRAVQCLVHTLQTRKVLTPIEARASRARHAQARSLSPQTSTPVITEPHQTLATPLPIHTCAASLGAPDPYSTPPFVAFTTGDVTATPIPLHNRHHA